jgi:uncharacterized linocin/CFP29 family protein
MDLNFILNGQGHGNVANTLMAHDFDPHALRPFIGNDGRSYITVNSGKMKDGKPVYGTIATNTTATLRKDEWIQFDTAIIKAARPRLRVVADLRAAGLEYVIPNGLSKTVLQYEAMSDISDASISMDGIRQSDADRPTFDLRNLPLPIIHKDFQFSARQVAASRNGGSPLDTTMAEAAGRKVAEEVEKLTLGESDSYAYGGGTIFGLKNFTYALTQDLTDPTDSDYVHSTTVSEVLAMRQSSMDNGYYGPWMLYYSPAWGTVMGEDCSTLKGDITLHERLKKIDGLQDVRQADYLSGTTMLLVQMTSDVVRVVVGMDITTVQWESHGGMQLNFKVMAIIVPQLRMDFTNQTGIVYGNISS